MLAWVGPRVVGVFDAAAVLAIPAAMAIVSALFTFMEKLLFCV
jgi:hypothetical protein